MSDQPDDDATVIRPSGGLPPPPPRAATATDGGNALAVGTYLGEFEITQVLGEGGFGIVYLAVDHTLERRVALKEYMPSALAARGSNSQVLVKSERHRDTFEAGLKSFINEAKLLAQFDHPSLVKVYRFWEAGGTAYMIMPYVQGKTLKDTLRERGTPPDEAWLMALLAPLTQALNVIHRERCYHRDIAPDNIILLAGSGRPLLLDFGAARRVIGDMTQALTVILKPGYAPVEQYAEVPAMKQGPWTDVYALAAVVYFAITGRTPPPSVGRMVSDSYVPLAESAAGRYSDRLLRAIDRALRVKPDDRTASMDELRADLGLETQTVDPHETLPAPSSGFSHTVQPTEMPRNVSTPGAVKAGDGGRRKLIAIGVGVVAVAATAIVAMQFLGPAEKTSPLASVAPAASSNTAAPQTAASTVAEIANPAAPAVTASAVVAEPATTPTAQTSGSSGSAATDLRAEFERIVASQSPGFDVAAVAAKTSLKIDRDRLAFSVKSSRDGFLHVLLYGPDGSLMLLYPNRKVGDNRIKAGQTLNLPQSSWPLVPGEPAGPERFLVVVTPERRNYAALSTGTESFYGFLLLPTADKAPAAGADGGLSWLLGKADCGRPDCARDYGAAVFTVDVVR